MRVMKNMGLTRTLLLTAIAASALAACGGGEAPDSSASAQSAGSAKAQALGMTSTRTGGSATASLPTAGRPGAPGGPSKPATSSSTDLSTMMSVLTSSEEHTFRVREVGPDHVEILATRKVGSVDLTLQIMLGATGSMNKGLPEFIRTLASKGGEQSLRVSFTGQIAGIDSTGALSPMSINTVAQGLVTGRAATDCGHRTHHALAMIASADGQTTPAVVGLWASKPDDGAVRMPSDGKACPDRKSYLFLGFEWETLDCGRDRCYNLFFRKYRVSNKIEGNVSVDGDKVSGGGSSDNLIILEEPVFVAGNCTKLFSFWGWPNSYYYCKCDTPQLTPQQ